MGHPHEATSKYKIKMSFQIRSLKKYFKNLFPDITLKYSVFLGIKREEIDNFDRNQIMGSNYFMLKNVSGSLLIGSLQKSCPVLYTVSKTAVHGFHVVLGAWLRQEWAD